MIVMRPTKTMTNRPTHFTLKAQAKNIPVRVRKYHHSREKGLWREGKQEEVKKRKKRGGERFVIFHA